MKNKKFLCLVLALIMVLGSFGPVFAAETKAADAAKAEKKDEKAVEVKKVTGKSNKIQYLVDNKFVEGRKVNEDPKNNDLALDKNIRRSEITKLLVYAIGEQSLAEKVKSVKIYTDVDASHWANGVIIVGSTTPSPANGLYFLNGYPDKSFKPEKDVTYAELAKMLVVLVKKDLTQAMYDNANAVNWPSQWITWAAELGILEDIKVEDFNKAANREDAFVMLYNALYSMKYIKKSHSNETLGILSQLNNNKLTLNQGEFEKTFTITPATTFVKYNQSNSLNQSADKYANNKAQFADVIKVSAINNPAYYYGSLVRVMADGEGNVTHIIELGNPLNLALGHKADAAWENGMNSNWNIDPNARWADVADATAETNIGAKEYKGVLDEIAKLEKEIENFDATGTAPVNPPAPSELDVLKARLADLKVLKAFYEAHADFDVEACKANCGELEKKLGPTILAKIDYRDGDPVALNFWSGDFTNDPTVAKNKTDVTHFFRDGNYTEDDENNAVYWESKKVELETLLTDETRYFVADVKANQLTEVKDVDAALRILGNTRASNWFMDVYVGYDTIDGADKQVTASNTAILGHNEAKVVVFNSVQKDNNDEQLLRVTNEATSLYDATFEDVNGKEVILNFAGYKVEMPFNFKDAKYNVVEVKKNNAFGYGIDMVIKASSAPVVKVNKVDGQYLIVEDVNGHTAILKIENTMVNRYRKFLTSDSLVGKHIQFRTIKQAEKLSADMLHYGVNNCNVIDTISVVPFELRKPLESVDVEANQKNQYYAKFSVEDFDTLNETDVATIDLYHDLYYTNKFYSVDLVSFLTDEVQALKDFAAYAGLATDQEMNVRLKLKDNDHLNTKHASAFGVEVLLGYDDAFNVVYGDAAAWKEGKAYWIKVKEMYAIAEAMKLYKDGNFAAFAAAYAKLNPAQAQFVDKATNGDANAKVAGYKAAVEKVKAKVKNAGLKIDLAAEYNAASSYSSVAADFVTALNAKLDASDAIVDDNILSIDGVENAKFFTTDAKAKKDAKVVVVFNVDGYNVEQLFTTDINVL